jgi:hypothetical protein
MFQSKTTPDLRGFTENGTGDTLPTEHGPWALDRQIGPDDEWTLNVSRASGGRSTGRLLGIR